MSPSDLKRCHSAFVIIFKKNIISYPPAGIFFSAYGLGGKGANVALQCVFVRLMSLGFIMYSRTYVSKNESEALLWFRRWIFRKINTSGANQNKDRHEKTQQEDD